MIFDGTLADISHRLHFIQSEPKDWPGFFAACPQDKPIPEVVRVCQALNMMDHRIVIISGRSDAVRFETAAWLQRYDVPCGLLFMRQVDDHRPDNIVKSELLDSMLDQWGVSIVDAEISGVFEDRQQVVDMYRERGLRVFQVAEGKF